MKPPYGFYDPPDTGYPCPICGYEVDRIRESWDYDADWQVCHEECLKEEANGERDGWAYAGGTASSNR